MNSLRIFATSVLVTAGLATFAAAQEKPSVVTMAESKFSTPTGFPPCVTTAVQRGDPTKGPSVILTKLAGRCLTPWHWHTTNEGGIVVKGKIELEIKGEATKTLVPGDYFYNPSKHLHHTTCLSECILSTTSDRARDVHYVDTEGKEIPPEQALRATPGKGE